MNQDQDIKLASVKDRFFMIASLSFVSWVGVGMAILHFAR